MGDRLTNSSAYRPGHRPSFGAAAGTPGEETLVVDARGQLRPAEMVERKLVNLLRSVPLPVSHVSASFRNR
jgi:hypothetical protein